MNEDGILLLSYVLEVLTLVSIVVAAMVLWFNWRAKRAARLKDARTPSSRLGGARGERLRK
ncbi:MAG: hypothetical protein U1E16_01610 [Hyphomicrobiales bacterium]|uniref:hypothetical protein n=1 Tax=Aestuariivirga sp. TaxID=2650926 RepID=UPI0035B061B8